MPLGFPLASQWELLLWFFLVQCLCASLGGLSQIPHELVQIVGENRPGTGHLQRLPQTFLGLVEPLFVALQGPHDAFGLASLASDRLADGLGNVPRSAAFGLDTNLLDTLARQGIQRCSGITSPIVYH